MNDSGMMRSVIEEIVGLPSHGSDDHAAPAEVHAEETQAVGEVKAAPGLLPSGWRTMLRSRAWLPGFWGDSL